LTEGVLNYQVDFDLETYLYNARVVFDETKTTVDKIIDTLAQGGYSVRGEPEFEE
jgi:hypothetical protein